MRAARLNRDNAAYRAAASATCLARLKQRRAIPLSRIGRLSASRRRQAPPCLSAHCAAPAYRRYLQSASQKLPAASARRQHKGMRWRRRLIVAISGVSAGATQTQTAAGDCGRRYRQLGIRSIGVSKHTSKRSRNNAQQKWPARVNNHAWWRRAASHTKGVAAQRGRYNRRGIISP